MISATAFLLTALVQSPIMHSQEIDPMPLQLITFAEQESPQADGEQGELDSGPPIDAGALLKVNKETLKKYGNGTLKVRRSRDGFTELEFRDLAKGIIHDRVFVHDLIYTLSKTCDLGARAQILKNALVRLLRRIKDVEDRRSNVVQPPDHLAFGLGSAGLFFPRQKREYEPYKEYYALREKAEGMYALGSVLRSWAKKPHKGLCGS